MTRTSGPLWLRKLSLALAFSLTLAAWPLSPVAAQPPSASDLAEATIVPGPGQQALITQESTQQVGPGMHLTAFTRFDARGWVHAYALRVDLSDPAISTDLLATPVVSAAEPLSSQARRAGAVAGVNGDFFDINNTKAPLGATIQGGELIQSPLPGWTKTVGVGEDRLGYLAEVLLEGTVTLPSGPHPLAALNQMSVPMNGIGLYTPRWGTTTPKGAAGGNAKAVTVSAGQVAWVTDGSAAVPIPTDGFVLLGREAGAQALAGLQVGDAVAVTYAPRSNTPSPLRFAVGGSLYLVQGGEIVTDDDRDTHPRTAVGFTADRREMILVAVDGRQRQSRGMTLRELAELMQSLGAHEAINLDGGGSSTLLARLPGASDLEVINSPSDGGERPVPNGVGIFAAPGSSELQGLRVEPQVAGENGHRLFPGLSRRFAAVGFDENYGPAPAGALQWRLLPHDLGSIDDQGRFVARKSGTANVEAKSRAIRGEHPLQVLGPLHRVTVEPGRLGLTPGQEGRFTVVGYDADGYAAPIDPEDIELAYEPGLVSITPTVEGAFAVTPSGEGGVLVSLTVQGKQVYLPITIGLRTEEAAGFEADEGWVATQFPASVGSELDFARGRNGDAARLRYDFTTTTATRAAYLQAEPLLELPGEPQAIGLWVHGDGQGAWLRAVLRDSANTNYTINLAPKVDWTGWRYVEAAVPPGVQYPLRLWRIYPVETNKERQYTGQLLFDDLTVKLAVSLDVPATPILRDPLIAQAPLSADRWRFALLTDLHIAARAPESKDLRHAREAFRQALAAEPDFIVIGGDFVDTAYPEDFALAQQLLAEEVGDRVPVYYIPGNHEIMGPGTLDNFRAAFGENRFSFDHKGTRFILLDSSTGSYRTADYPQLLELAASLQAAAADPRVKNVVVIGHHPTRDPMPTQSSQLVDQLEARLVEQMLTRFRSESDGKGAIYLAGHAHTVDLRRVEGLPYMVMGSVGKSPYGPADQGGFYAWTLFGIDPTPFPDRAAAEGPEWIQAEVRPILGSITLEAPEQVQVGEQVAVAAWGQQSEGRTFPLRYPATVLWSGSQGLLVASGAEVERALAGGQYLAHFDPETGSLRALKPGSITLTVEAGGLTESAEITLAP